MNQDRFRPGHTTGAIEEHSASAKTTPKDTPLPTPAISEARRSGRIKKEISILLFGSDIDGCVFTEETRTVVLSLHGAGIVSRHRLMPEQELVLRWKETGREAEVRVVGEVAQQGAFHTYGVAFVNERPNFWEMEFPPAPDQPERPVVLLLECGACGEAAELLNGDFEYDICAIHGGLTRFCRECGMLTVWRQRQDAIPALKKRKLEAVEAEVPTLLPEVAVKETARTVEAADAVFLPAAEATGGDQERRSRTRAKVNFFACVRSDAFGEEVVTCLDMAKGGVGFKTRNQYEKDAIIQIAVPYAAEERQAPAIFVNGRIANVRPMEIEGMYRCGVEFLK